MRSFSLWDQPWIDVLTCEGRERRVSIAEVLAEAHQLRAIQGTSPLTSAGIQRFIIAIGQEIFAPPDLDALAALLARGQFDPAPIAAFGARYRDRFALFDDAQPFLQRPGETDDIKRKDRKSAAALFHEVPSGTRRAWFTRHYEDDYTVCPACAGQGLVSYSTFATGFGPGIRATLTGEGALFILPSGPTLFDALARSLLTPAYLPPLADPERAASAPWRWEPDTVGSSARQRIGYLESLIFPARVIRLIPEDRTITCKRCGEQTDIAVPQTLLERGWYYGIAATKGATVAATEATTEGATEGAPRPRGAERLLTWIDPFCAYRTAKSNGATVPVRTSSNIAPWRELATLIGQPADSSRPLVLDQLLALVEAGAVPAEAPLAIRCVGLHVIKQANYRNWIDESMQFPPALLRDPEAATTVALALERAQTAMKGLGGVLSSGGGVIGQPVASDTIQAVWGSLAAPFRAALASFADPAAREDGLAEWGRTILRIIEAQVALVLEQSGDMSHALRGRVIVRQGLGRLIGSCRKKWELRV